MRGTSSSACAILPPTAYTAVLDGTPQTLRYEVLGGSELAPVGELPALPAWLVEILNKRGVRPVPSRQQRGAEARDGASSDSEPLGEPEPDLLSEELQAEVVSELKRMLSSWGDNVSVFAMAVPSSTGRGVLYQFRNGGGGRADCPYFPASQGLHDSNNFALWRRGVEITYLCFGERCKVVPRDSHIRLGILSFPVAAAFGDSQPLNSYRDHLYSDRELLPLAFLKENLNAAKGDVGGANILERIYLRTGLKFVYTPNGSYYWSGTCWIKDESGGRLQRVFREELTKVAKAYRKEKGLGEFAPNPTSKEELLEQKKKKESLVNFDFNSRMSNVLATSKEYFFQSGFEGKLDQRKDHRVVANGVIDLRTGKLERHHPRFLNSCTLEWPFPEQGLDYPKGRMLEFLESIMFVNGVDGRAAVEHLQILLGYGFTGHTSNQVLAIFMGEGSAGKSALLQLLRKLLGPAYKDVGKEMVVNARGQRAASKGAASPLEAGLRGILLAVIEETNQSDTLDEAGVKKLTGTDIITARPLYKDFITFSANMLLILCTNNLPRTEAEWTVALRRRLQLVVFPRRYFASHERGYEPENPLHGLVNPRLTTELSASQHMQELLVWLVEGAVKWYRNGQQLGTMPARSLEALEMYEEENDDFQKFVIYSCETGRDYFIGTTEAIEAYNDPGRMVDGKLVEFVDRIGATKLKKLMNARGFKGPGKPSDLGLQMPGCETRGYRGLRLKTLVG